MATELAPATDRATPRSARPLLALAAGAVVLIAASVVAWQAFPLPFLATLRLLRRLGLLLVLCGAFAGWGELLCRWLRAGNVSWIARTALGASATATVEGYLAPWWFPNAIFAVPWLLVGWGLLVPQLRSAVAGETPPAPSAAPPGSRWIWAAALVFLQPPLLMALAPPTTLDGLVYHLALPRQAALLGHLGDMPWLQLSYFPQHAEMLFGMALAVEGGVLAQLLHLAAAVAAVATAARIAGRCFGPAAAPWTALLLASSPVLNLIAGSAGNDWFVVLYICLALEQHLRRADEPAAAKLEAIFLGAAIATKYTALPALILLLLPWRSLSWRRLGASAALVLLVALPWYGRNLLLQHNPVFPLLSGNAGGADLANFRGGGPLPTRLRHYLFEPQLVDESPGLLLPAMVAVAALLLPGRRRIAAGLLALPLLYAVPLLTGNPTVRAFAPGLAALAILAGGGAALVVSAAAARRALAAFALLLLPIHLMGILVVWELERYRPLKVVAGLEDEETYVRASQPYLAAFREIARHAPADARVLVVGESRVFYLDRPAIFGCFIDPHPLAAFAGNPPDALEAASRLRAAGVQLIFVYPPQLRIGQRPPGVPYELRFYASPELDRAFNRLLAEQAHPVFHDGDAWVFALGRGSSQPAATPPAASR